MSVIKVTIENGKVVTLATAKVTDKIYDIPCDMDSLTIDQARAIYDYMAENASQKYISFMSGEVIEEKVWSSELKKNTHLVCGAIALVSGLPLEALEASSFRQQRMFCNIFELNVIRPLYMLGAYQPKGIESFEHNGVTYMLPKFSDDGFGGMLPMAEESAEAFCESNDLVTACDNVFENMPLIVAILCRPEGEQYDERTARQRAEEFKQLPASVAFEVFFCKLSRLSIFLGYMGEHLEQLQAKVRKAEAKS